MSVPMAMMAAQGAGSLFSAMGARDAAKAQKSALQAEAILAETNSKILEMNAQGELLAGQREEQKVRLSTAQLKGTQKANLAANGIALDADPTSTVNNILTSTDTLGEIDANTVASNAIRAAWGYRFEAVSQTNSALMSRAASKGISPNKAMLTSLLGSATSMGTNYYSMKKAGL